MTCDFSTVDILEVDEKLYKKIFDQKYQLHAPAIKFMCKDRKEIFKPT